MKTRIVRGLFLVSTCLVCGCGGDSNPGVIPESKDSASTHAFIENTAGIPQRKAKTAKASKGNELPPQPPK